MKICCINITFACLTMDPQPTLHALTTSWTVNLTSSASNCNKCALNCLIDSWSFTELYSCSSLSNGLFASTTIDYLHKLSCLTVAINSIQYTHTSCCSIDRPQVILHKSGVTYVIILWLSLWMCFHKCMKKQTDAVYLYWYLEIQTRCQ